MRSNNRIKLAIKSCIKVMLQTILRTFISRNEMILSILITKITHCGKLYAYYFAISFYRWKKPQEYWLKLIPPSLYSFLLSAEKFLLPTVSEKSRFLRIKFWKDTKSQSFYLHSEHMPINLFYFTILLGKLGSSPEEWERESYYSHWSET